MVALITTCLLLWSGFNYASETSDLRELVKSSSAFSIELPVGTEAYVRAAYEMSPQESLYLLQVFHIERLMGNPRSPAAQEVAKHEPTIEVWAIQQKSDGDFNTYAVVDSLARQTLDPLNDLSKNYFVKAIRPVTAYVDFGKLGPELEVHLKKTGATLSLRDRCTFALVDQALFYPISNLAMKEVESSEKDESVCPVKPVNKDGSACPKTEGIDLSKSTKLLSYLLEAQEATGVDAALLSAILTQESRFDPYSENLEEKRSCKNTAKIETCPKYGWSKGLAQLGSQMAMKYGLNWATSVPRFKECKRRGVISNGCMTAFERYCKRHKKGGPSVFCPKEAIGALAQYLGDILKKDRRTRVLLKDSWGKINDRVIDFKSTFLVNDANRFQFAAGEYNRGFMVDNSIEELYRQLGRAPASYGEAWAIKRKTDTPSKEIGFKILNREYLNRCYVWNIAGLCGESLLPGSLGAYYRKFFPKDED
ncbi:MAG: hypothetical protein AABZ55_08225 [Bdellovibrionota bacterium]